MHSYKEVEKAIWSELPMGLSYSMPVPVLDDGKLLDTVFVFSVNRKTRSANESHAIIQVDLSNGSSVLINEPEIFERVSFEATPFEAPESFAEKTSEAQALYGEVREEIAGGSVGAASKRYAKLVLATTQKSLRPYYHALSPVLFANCQ